MALASSLQEKEHPPPPGALGTPEGVSKGGWGRKGGLLRLCPASIRMVGAAPASSPWPPLPLSRCHMRKGLQLGVPPITQHQCRELPPQPPSRLLAPGPENRLCSCSVGEEASGYRWQGLDCRPVVGRCGLEAAPERGLGRTPAQASPRGQADGQGPRSTNCVICEHPGVCVCGGGGVGGGWAGAADVRLGGRRGVTENPEVRTQRLASAGAWPSVGVGARHGLPAPSTRDKGTQAGRGQGHREGDTGAGRGGYGFLGSRKGGPSGQREAPWGQARPRRLEEGESQRPL